MKHKNRYIKAEKWGKWAERLCILLLLLKGYSIVARHFTTGRGTGAGEIDIIAKRGNLLAFIEVKARKDYTIAAESITPHQQKRIYKSASVFLKFNSKYETMNIRFDAMLVVPWQCPKHIIDAWREGL